MVIKMQKHYHFTSYENLESINEYGLVPKSGGRTMSVGDNRCGVFLSQGMQNAILMYSSILWHYNCHCGDLGTKSIKHYKDNIKYYNKLLEQFPGDEEYMKELEATKKAIAWVKQIMSYKNFFEYIGDGVYLSVSELGNVTSYDASDCCITKNIPTEKIKVVILKNKETGEIIDSRESVLAYFMSIIPKENIIYSTPNVITRKIIEDLYKNKLEEIKYYNMMNFELEEIPINLYFSIKKDCLESNKKR